MKICDLVRSKRSGDLALIIDIEETKEIPEYGSPIIYKYIEFMWLDTGEIDSCSSTLLETIHEGG